MSVSRTVELVTRIDQRTRLLDDYFRDNGLPSPSFDASTPPILPLPAEIEREKEDALEAIDGLKELLMGPMPKIFSEFTQTVRKRYF